LQNRPVLFCEKQLIREGFAGKYRRGKTNAAPPIRGLLYSWPMQEKVNRPGWLAQICCCVWLAGAQIWYYLQFKTLLVPLAKSFVRSVWR
jgi:hypothetical protein